VTDRQTDGQTDRRTDGFPTIASTGLTATLMPCKNHVIDWNQVKVIGHESDRRTRWIKKAIAICKCKGKCMNRDTGSYILPSSYDKLLLCEPDHSHRYDTSRRRVDTQF